MTTTTFSMNSSHTTDASFRTIVQTCITALTAVGLVQTADTGQINTSTVVTPYPTSAAVGGYAIFRFNDAFQSTKPVFIKLEFGNGNNGTTPGFQIWLTVGSATDGAGNITITLFPRTPLLSTVSSGVWPQPSTTVRPGVASGNGGYICFLPWIGSDVTSVRALLPWFILERSPDGNSLMLACRNATAGGTTYVASTSAAGYPIFTAITHSTQTYNQGMVPVNVPYSIAGTALGATTSLAGGAIGPVYPWAAIAPGSVPWQCLSALSYPGGDAPGAPFTVNMDGTDHTYYPIPLTDSHHSFGMAMSPSSTVTTSHYVGLAIRWE